MGKISLVMNASANGKWQFSTFLNFEKSKKKSDLFMLLSKIGQQIDYFGEIKRNSKFRPCRRILDIYSNWLLNTKNVPYLRATSYPLPLKRPQCFKHM